MASDRRKGRGLDVRGGFLYVCLYISMCKWMYESVNDVSIIAKKQRKKKKKRMLKYNGNLSIKRQPMPPNFLLLPTSILTSEYSEYREQSFSPQASKSVP